MPTPVKNIPKMILSAIVFFVLFSNTSIACDYLDITITSPSDGDTFNISTIMVNGTASDSEHALYKVEVNVNGGGWILANGTDVWSASITLVPGSNTITAMVTDDLEYTKDTLITVTYTPQNITQDTTPPQILEMWPPVGAVLAQNNVELGAITDENATCKYDAYNTSYGSMNNMFFKTNGTEHRQPLTLADSTYTYYVRCIDNSGNANQESKNTTFTVNTSTTPVLLDHDVSITGLSVPATATVGSAISVSALLKNIGKSNETNIPVIFSVDGVSLQTSYFNLSSLENSTLSFSWAAVLGSHNLSLFANMTTDMNFADNNASAVVSVSAAPQTPPPSSGGGGGGGGSYFPPTYNKDAYFSIVTIPDTIYYGDPLYASGCVLKVDRNSTLNMNLDGTLKNSTKIFMPSTCFNLSAGTPSLGKHAVYLQLKDSKLNLTKNVSVIKKIIPSGPDVKILDISIANETNITVGVPVVVFVRVAASKPSEMSLTIFFDSKKIGSTTANVSGEDTFPFEYTFDAPGEKVIAAVASTKGGEDSMLKKIYVKEKEETTPTGQVTSASSKWWAILVLIIIAVAGYYYLKKL